MRYGIYSSRGNCSIHGNPDRHRILVFCCAFLSTWFILPGWVANGAKKEELKDALLMVALFFVFLFCAFMLAEIGCG